MPKPMRSGPARRVHVWWLPLPAGQESTDRCLDALSRAERVRAERFVTDEARNRFVVTRGALRLLLSSQLGRQATELDFVQGALGKPHLPDEDAWFNVSHTPGLAVIAISRATPVGIDVERINPRVDVVGVAGLALGSERTAALSRLEGEERVTSFFKAWVEEEACVKAVGGTIAAAGVGLKTDGLDVVALATPRAGFAAALAGRGPLEVVVESEGVPSL